MTDFYLKALTEDEMNVALLDAGVLVEVEGEFYPAPNASVDVIGPFSRMDYSVDPPVEKYYPEWHVNVRWHELTEEQIAVLQPYMLVPPELPYRVWA